MTLNHYKLEKLASGSCVNVNNYCVNVFLKFRTGKSFSEYARVI